MGELSEQDEEFLESINGLSEDKKNNIIAYIKNKIDSIVFWHNKDMADKIELFEDKLKELEQRATDEQMKPYKIISKINEIHQELKQFVNELRGKGK